MTLIDSTRTDLRSTSRSSVAPTPAQGSYITTSRTTTPQRHASTGTYPSRMPASAAPGSYVTTGAPSAVSGGSYTYTG